MKTPQSQAILLTALASTFTLQAVAQTTFSHDNMIAITAVGGGEDLLTEGAPGPPVIAIGGAVLGLVAGDHIDALSFGDDTPLMSEHRIVFSVDANSIGRPGSGVPFEFHVDSAPCAGSAPVPAAACGDIFIQSPVGGSHILAPSGFGYRPGGVAAGDECYAKWAGGNFPPPGAADDLNAFDYTAPTDAAGIYFSLAPGSPTLAAIAATPGDILYSDLSAAAPVIATLGGGAGSATAANLGIALSDLDALSLVGTTGSVGGGGGVIATGSVGAAPANTGAVSTHFLEFSVTRGGGAVGFAGEVLVRTGPGVAAVFVPAEEGLGLAIVNEDELNALEVIPTPMIPTVSQWGIMVMTLLVLTAGTLVLRHWPLAAHGQERNAEPVS